MRPMRAAGRCARSGSAALLALTIVTGGACHRSARAIEAPLPVDTLDSANATSVRAHRGGNIRSLDLAEIARLRVQRVEELLGGRVVGLRVLPTANGGFAVRLRGATLQREAEPLYIIDGVPTTVVPGEGLNWLDPAEIVHIEVLKDPADTSVYGARGANGVVVIRTLRRPR